MGNNQSYMSPNAIPSWLNGGWKGGQALYNWGASLGQGAGSEAGGAAGMTLGALEPSFSQFAQAAQGASEASAAGGGLADMALTVAETLPSMISDARLKQDIRRVGLLDNGLPVYAFRFMGGPTQIGLLAQEVQQALPEAVTKGPKGLLAVNYDMATQAPQQGPPQGAMPPPQGMPPQMPQQPPMSPQMAPQGMPMGGAPNGMG